MTAVVVSVGASLFLFQQLAGINVVVYYSTSVFRSAGIASDAAASAFVGLSNVLGESLILILTLSQLLIVELYFYIRLD